jgi:hypothetical protein
MEMGAAEIAFLKGSPRVALEITNPFTRYIFVDRDPGRIAELDALKLEYKGKRAVTVQQNGANARAQGVAGNSDRLARAQGSGFSRPIWNAGPLD